MARETYHGELEQLRLQVEVMAIAVGENLGRMQCFVVDGSPAVAEEAIAFDDGIDAMHASLTARCYDLLLRETPVADELRFVVSVIRILSELERIGDLSLRVTKLGDERGVLAGEHTFEYLRVMSAIAVEAFDLAAKSWSAQDLSLAPDLQACCGRMDAAYAGLLEELLSLRGTHAVRIATGTLLAAQALERIADHARIMIARLRYLVTGDPEHLTAEVR